MKGTNKDHDEKKDVARELHWGKPNPKLVPTIPYIQLIYSEELKDALEKILKHLI